MADSLICRDRRNGFRTIKTVATLNFFSESVKTFGHGRGMDAEMAGAPPVAPPVASASGIMFGNEERAQYLKAADGIKHPRNELGRDIVRPAFGVHQGIKFLDLQARAGSAAADPTIANFKTLLESYLRITGQIDELNPRTLRIIIQQRIIAKIKKLKEKHVKYTKGLNEKIDYFASERFLNALLTPIPKKESLITTNVIKTSYTDWLNTLLDAKFQDWRDDALAPIDNTVQCISAGAGGILKKGSIRNYQNNNDTICYLCNRSTRGGELSTMECEHILPVICALSHWWLIKNPPETEEELQELLGREYDWAHRCCNQIKSNLELIKLRSNDKYGPNIVRIEMLLRRISDSPPKYDCNKITPAISKEKQIKFIKDMADHIIKTKIEPILQVVNQNIVEFDDYGLYEIFTKLKILAAIEDDTFLKVMIGSGEPTVTVPKKKGAAIRAAFSRGAFTGGGDEYYELSVPMLNMMASFCTDGEITDYTLLGNIEDVDYLIAAYIQFNPDFFIQQDEYPELARMYTELADIPRDVPEYANTRALIAAGVGGATRSKNRKSKSKRRASKRRNSSKRQTKQKK